MAGPKATIGVNNLEKLVSEIQIGVSNSAKKVTKGYIGVTNAAKLFYTADWWRLDGISKSDILATFQFKGAASAAAALKNLANSSYNLSNTNCTWATGSGFRALIRTYTNNISDPGWYLDSSALRSAGIKSMAIRIGGTDTPRAVPLTTFGGVSVWLNTPVAYASFYYADYSHGLGVAHENGLSVDYVNPPYATGNLPRNRVRVAHATYNNCVIGINLNSAGTETIYKNGTAVSLSNATGTQSYAKDNPWHGFIASGVPRLIGGYQNSTADPGGSWANVTNHDFVGSFWVIAMACYSTTLSQGQHAELAENMNAI